MNKAAAKYMRKSEGAFTKTLFALLLSAVICQEVKRYLEVGNVDDLSERRLSKHGFGCLFLFIDNLNAEKIRLLKMFIEVCGKVF